MTITCYLQLTSHNGSWRSSYLNVDSRLAIPSGAQYCTVITWLVLPPPVKLQFCSRLEMYTNTADINITINSSRRCTYTIHKLLFTLQSLEQKKTTIQSKHAHAWLTLSALWIQHDNRDAFMPLKTAEGHIYQSTVPFNTSLWMCINTVDTSRGTFNAAYLLPLTPEASNGLPDIHTLVFRKKVSRGF